MPIDFPGIRARHRLADVARRCGYPIDASSGDVTVCCPRPEHDDSTPSVVLHLNTDRHHCFGCGATGDVVQWIPEGAPQDIAGDGSEGEPIDGSGRDGLGRQSS